MYSLVFVLIEKTSNTRDSVSSAIQTPQNMSKILPACHILTLVLVLVHANETLSLVFDITLKNGAAYKHTPNLAKLFLHVMLHTCTVES